MGGLLVVFVVAKGDRIGRNLPVPVVRINVEFVKRNLFGAVVAH